MFEGAESVEFTGKCIVSLAKGTPNEIAMKCALSTFVNQHHC